MLGRPRKAGPPPERKMEGSIDVIGAEGSRGTLRKNNDHNYLIHVRSFLRPVYMHDIYGQF